TTSGLRPVQHDPPSLHDALPIYVTRPARRARARRLVHPPRRRAAPPAPAVHEEERLLRRLELRLDRQRELAVPDERAVDHEVATVEELVEVPDTRQVGVTERLPRGQRLVERDC